MPLRHRAMRVGCGVNALSDLRFYPCVGLIRRASVASGKTVLIRRIAHYHAT
ncbi:hypothetical protein ACQP3J_04490 [Escherichia coli]